MQEFADNLALRSQAMKDNLHTFGVGYTELFNIVSSHARLGFFFSHLSNHFSF